MAKFSKKAKRHAAWSARDRQRQIDQSRQPGPVKISYLPGFKDPRPQTKFPFKATINGEPVIVWPDWIEEDRSDEDPYDVDWRT